ncbi:MAG: septum formation initiator family protein [Armatimonadota bacterium]
MGGQSKIRRRPKSAGRPGKFRRIVSKLLVICLVAGGGYMFLDKLSRPYRISHGEAKEIAETKRQIKAEEEQNRALKQNIEFLKTDSGREVEARRLGWVKPGEVAIVVEQPSLHPETIEVKEPPRHKSFWNAVKGIFIKKNNRKP